MIGAYQSFFVASTGASAAFIGLLFVALSFLDARQVDEKVRSWWQIMANSSFAQLVDVFFVSLIGLTPDTKNLAIAGCVLAAFGLLIAFKLLARTIDSATTGRTRPSILGLIAVAAYLVQFVAGVGLFHNPNSRGLFGGFLASLIILYAGALARAWEITGLKQR